MHSYHDNLQIDWCIDIVFVLGIRLLTLFNDLFLHG